MYLEVYPKLLIKKRKNSVLSDRLFSDLRLSFTEKMEIHVEILINKY